MNIENDPNKKMQQNALAHIYGLQRWESRTAAKNAGWVWSYRCRSQRLNTFKHLGDLQRRDGSDSPIQVCPHRDGFPTEGIPPSGKKCMLSLAPQGGIPPQGGENVVVYRKLEMRIALPKGKHSWPLIPFPAWADSKPWWTMFAHNCKNLADYFAFSSLSSLSVKLASTNHY